MGYPASEKRSGGKSRGLSLRVGCYGDLYTGFSRSLNGQIA